MIVAFGHVDPDLDHGRRDEHVELAVLEAAHHLAPVGRLQLPVQEADAVARELGPVQPFGLDLGGAGEAGLRLLDQRADDVGLASGVEMHTEPRVGVARALRSHPRRHDRLAVRRRLCDLADGEVAVDRQRERAGDRRGGHVQDVWASAVGKCVALLDAEAVLLVDDCDREIGELDVALDQRVRADGEVGGAVRQLGADLLRTDRAGQQHRAHAERRAERLDRQEVLLGQGFGRRHQRSLPAGLDRAQECVERDDRLAGADVALQQALHRHRLREVAGRSR